MTDTFFSKNKTSIVLTMAFLMIGTLAYFLWVPASVNVMSPQAIDILKSDLQLKAAYTPEGVLKIFALAKNNDLAKLRVQEGNAVPEYNSVVIGSAEAAMMKSEKLFNTTNDKLSEFFGTDVIIGGVLEKTGTVVDDFHFLSDSNFASLTAEQNRLFVRVVDDSMAKLFYTLMPEELFASMSNESNVTIDVTPKLAFSLTQGSLDNYKMDVLAGVTYSPLLVGYDEAMIMKEEKLFSKPGDVIRGFFGNDVVVVGILAKTNTSLDMVHILPLTSEQVN
ncbi:MAG TPA: hypothetical protein VK158_01725 [Acidobacteriota bacterium]|nr:hypothetical protein [Acidobacteriota bacterium]